MTFLMVWGYWASSFYLPVMVGPRLGKLPSWPGGLMEAAGYAHYSAVFCNRPRPVLKSSYQTDFGNSSRKFHFTSDPNQTDFRRLFSQKNNEVSIKVLSIYQKKKKKMMKPSFIVDFFQKYLIQIFFLKIQIYKIAPDQTCRIFQVRPAT